MLMWLPIYLAFSPMRLSILWEKELNVPLLSPVFHTYWLALTKERSRKVNQALHSSLSLIYTGWLLRLITTLYFIHIIERKGETSTGWEVTSHASQVAERGHQTHFLSSLIFSFNSFMLNILYMPDIMSEPGISDK